MAFWSKKKEPVDKVQLLSRYSRGEGGVVLLSEVPVDVEVPLWWRDLPAMDQANRVLTAVGQWGRNEHIRYEMRNTIMYLKEYCQDVEVMRVGASYYLLYSIKNRLGEMVYFVGGNPLRVKPNEAVCRLWQKIPESVKGFYGFHDGFFDYETATGFDPLAELICIGDLDWGVIDQLGLEVQVDMSASLAFLSNRSGDYLVVDTNDCENNKAVLWSSQMEPLYDQTFWDIADEWIVIFLEAV